MIKLDIFCQVNHNQSTKYETPPQLMYTNISTWSYLENKSSHLLHKHKHAEIHSSLPNCWAYSPTTFCLGSTINCLAVPGTVGEQIQVSQSIGNFPSYEAKRTAQITATLNIFSLWSVPEEYRIFKMLTPSARSVVLYFTVVRVLARHYDHESDVGRGLSPILSKSTMSKWRDQNKLVPSRPSGCSISDPC
jgi:hypothetical protein